MSLIDDFRNGKRYGTDWKAPTVQHMNNLVETVSNDDLIVQSIASTVDTSEVDNYGTASVAMIGEGTKKYLKFKNLKGKGIKSIAYTSTDSKGNRIYTVTMDDNSSYTIQSDKGTGFNPRGTWTSGTAYVRDTNTIDTVFYNGSSYYCKTSHTASSTILPTNTTYWGMLAEQGQAPGIIDNLTTADTTKALSANQGKLLNDEITKIKNGTTRVGDTKKVSGIDFTENTVAKFGNYTIQKKIKLWEGDTKISNTGVTIELTSGTIAVGDTIELLWGGMTGYPSTGYRYDRFRVMDISGSGSDMAIMGLNFYGDSYLYIGGAKLWTTAENGISFGVFNFFAMEGTNSGGTTLKTRIPYGTAEYHVYEISKIIE